MSTHYDAIVIGGGQSGPFLAEKLAREGKRVAVFEKRDLGGTCVNRGCTPTKTLRKSARVAHVVRKAAAFGVGVSGFEVDFAAAMNRMQARVDASRDGLTGWLEGTEGLTIVRAHGRLDGRDDIGRLCVSGGPDALTADTVYLNTGTRPFVPPIPGLDSVDYLTNESLLALRTRPPRLIILGGSYIGLEMGQIFGRLGCGVEIVEAGPRVAGREDPDISAMLEEMLRAEGIVVHTGAGAERVASDGDGVVLHLADGRAVRGSHLLVATGRVPNTDDLGLDTLSIETDRRGYITTNGQLQTAVPDVYALGDINRRGAFTHTSYHDQEIVWANLHGGARSADGRTMAYAMFTDPPLGHVGVQEAEARALVAEGRAVSVAQIDMANVSRAKEEGETIGRIKFWIDEADGKFLGATMLGIQADEIIQSISLLMAAGGTIHDVLEALPVHPTVTEFFPTILARRKALDA